MKIVRAAGVWAVYPYLVKIVNMVKIVWAAGVWAVYPNLVKIVKKMLAEKMWSPLKSQFKW